MKLKKVLLFALVIASSITLNAQLNNSCPGCVINQAAFGANPASSALGLHPDTIVIRQNDSVNVDATYMMPQTLAVGSITATVTSIQILGLNASSPLPTGLNITCDQAANNCTYNPQTNRFGCVKVCGRTSDPATNGVQRAKITVTGCGTALGVTQCQNQDIPVYYIILPDTTACHQICFQNKINTGCDTATIVMNPGIDISCPNAAVHPCEFNWNFGNGVTGIGLSQQTAFYSAPGTYPVTLQKKTKKFQVTNINVTAGGSWWHSIDNLYGLVTSAVHLQANFSSGTFSTSTSTGGGLSGSWSNLGWDLDNQSIAIQIENNGLTSNEYTGTFTSTVTGPGTFSFSIGGTDATGTYTVALLNRDSIIYNDSVIIYARPDTPVIVSNKDTVCSGDSIKLSIGSKFSGYRIQWYLDTIFLAGKIDTSIYVYGGGNYWVNVIDPVTHCSRKSLPKSNLFFGDNPQTGLSFIQTPTQLILNPDPSSSQISLEWYKDGAIISGQNTATLTLLGNGTYWARAFNKYYGVCSVNSVFDTVNVSGINELNFNQLAAVSVFPNPNNGQFKLKLYAVSKQNITFNISNVIGEVVYQNTVNNIFGDYTTDLDLSMLSKGVYTINLQSEKSKLTKKIVIE